MTTRRLRQRWAGEGETTPFPCTPSPKTKPGRLHYTKVWTYLSTVVPSSCTIGALSHLSMYNSAHLHVICFRTARSRSLWSMLSHRPLMSNSSTQPYFQHRSPPVPLHPVWQTPVARLSGVISHKPVFWSLSCLLTTRNCQPICCRPTLSLPEEATASTWFIAFASESRSAGICDPNSAGRKPENNRANAR